ncbi:heterokaryon incompatibility protein-domain-containing protein, partial [Leptodontidium sp. 2 PMI_412]
QLPSRVIDVGAENEEPHLHISHGECVPYATLSHCWGGLHTLTTTTDTLEARKQEIPLSAFPKTYKDAVLITRGLGIKYVWIDSLCIVQDDKLDWSTESLQMANIYSNAEILIAASDSANSSEGCLNPREAPWKMEYTSPESTTSGDGPKPFLLVYPYPSFLFSILKVRLNTRAWCLQEVALSRRTLHCTNSRLYWQCGRSVWSEDGLDPYNGTPDSEFGANIRFNLPTRTLKTWRKPWAVAVMDYSSRQLTFQSDKMAAMLGLTNFFKEKLNDVPVFGLWRDSLHYGLLW